MGVTTSQAPLESWTRTLNEPDAIALLEGAEPGMAIAEWLEWGDTVLPQASRPRRRETLRIVRQALLDERPDETIADSVFLRLFRSGSPHRRQGLLYGRLLADNPWILRALAALVHPAIRAHEVPLAPEDSDLITQQQWLAFLEAQADLPPAAAKKTRSTVQKHLEALGVLTSNGPARKETHARRAEPDPLAFGWLLAYAMVRAHRTEAPESWARTESSPAVLFAVTPDYAGEGLEAAIRADLLRRGFLAGSPRLHLTGEMLRLADGEHA